MKDLRRHERVAVAIAPDPASHVQKRGQLRSFPGRVGHGELILDLRIDPWQLAQEGVVVV